MTGKEKKNKKSYYVEETPEKLSYICETLYEENMKLKEKLTKYKKSFEILKERLNLRVVPNLMVDDEVKNMCLIYDRRPYIVLNKEEAELLEELIK